MTTRSNSRRAGAIAAFCAVVACTRVASAEPSAADLETARSLMKEGKRLRAAGEYASAIERLRAAHELVPTAVTGYQLAAALADAGRLVEARAAALGAVLLPHEADETDASVRARAESRALADTLEARIPSLQVSIAIPPGAIPSLAIDGEGVPPAALLVPHKLDPGKHAVTVTAAGAAPYAAEVTLAERETRELAITLLPGATAPAGVASLAPATPSEPSAPVRSKMPAYVSFGAGGVFAIAGAVTGALAFAELSGAKSHCQGTQCLPAARSGLDASYAMGTVSTVTFALAGAACLTGAILLAFPVSTRANVAVDVGPRFTGIEGRF